MFVMFMFYCWVFEIFFLFIGDEFVMVEIFEVHSGGGGVKKQNAKL
jgi:hypothetical protein